MKKIFLSILCFMLVNYVFAQVTDTTMTKTKNVKTTTITQTTTTTVITTEENDTIRRKAKRLNVVTTDKKNIVKLTIVGVSYERALTSRASLLFNTNYSFGRTSGTTYSGFGVGLEARFYPKSVLGGFFVALSPRYQNYGFYSI